MRVAAMTLLCLLTLPVLAEEERALAPFVGTWDLAADRSRYADEPVPVRMTVMIENTARGLAYRSETQVIGGRVTTATFVAQADQRPVVVIGNAGFLAPVTLASADDGGIDATYWSGLKKVAWSHWLVSGTELAIKTTYLDGAGTEKTNIAAFKRRWGPASTTEADSRLTD